MKRLFTRIVFFSALGIWLILINVVVAEAQQAEPEPRLIIISVPDFSFHEFAQISSDEKWTPLLNRAEVAAMNVRTKKANLESRYVSMALGYDAADADQINHVSELVGEKLRQRNVRRAVWGAHSLNILQDRFGSLSEELMTKTWLEAIETVTGPSVLILERSGFSQPTTRVHALEMLYTDVNHVMFRMNENDTLWLLSPQVHEEARKTKSYLAPFLTFSKSRGGGRLLFSATTHRPGLISYKDIAPSILDHFDIQSERGNVEGHPVQAASFEQEELHVQALMKLTNRIEAVYQLRPQILYPIVLFEAIVLVIGLALLYWRPNSLSRAVVLRLMLMSLLTIPGVLLLMGAYPGLPSKAYVVAFFILLLWSILPVIRYSWANVLFGVSAMTVVLILVDGWTGARLMKHSILGYDPIIGARYYGIGNEYMGVLIGTALIAAGVLYNKRELHSVIRNGLVLVMLGTVLIYMALPQGGANAGGTITATVAFGCFFLLHSRWNKRRFWWWILVLPLAGLIVLLVFNRLLPSANTSSHIGQGLSQLFSGNFTWILKIIQRKLAMNWYLIGASNWTKLLLAGILVFAVCLLFPRFHRGRQWASKYKHWKAIFASIAVAALTAFAFNDSGLVSAATIIVYAAVPLIWIQAESRTVVTYKKASHSS